MIGHFCELVIAQFWQVTLVAMVAWLLAETLLRRQPRLQFAVWSVVLLKCLIPPLAPSLVWPGILSGPNVWGASAVGSRVVSTETLTKAVEIELIDETLNVAASNRSANLEPTIGFQQGILLSVWLLGITVVGSLIVVQIARCRQQTRRRYRRPNTRLLAEFSQLQGIFPARCVQLVVTRGRLGPAVVNPLRPKLLMPGGLAKRLGSSELRPILAHEMMHVRRGDLWLGWLQTACVLLYWFHPLVWLASRRLSIVIEQCCDEDTVRWSQCDPNDYRRGLVATLLWKNSVPVLPIASAIRPAHLTRYRMEALMKIDPLRPQSRWISRLTLLALAALMFPGARWPAQATPPSDNKPASAVESPEEERTQKISLAANESTDDTKDTRNFPKTYLVSDLLPSLNRPIDLSPKQYTDVVFRSDFESLMREIQQTVAPEYWEARGGRGTMAPYMQTVSIVIAATSEVHDQVSDFLKAKRARQKQNAEAVTVGPLNEPADSIAESTAVVELGSLMLRGKRDDLVRACDHWTNLQDDIATITRRDAVEVLGRGKSSSSTGENSLPLHVQWSNVEIAIVERLSSIVDEPNFGRNVRLLSRPMLRLPLQQTGMISIGEDFIVKRKNATGDFDSIRYWGGIRLELNVDAIDPNTNLRIKWSSQELITNPSGDSTPAVIEKRSLKSVFELASEKAVLLLATDGDDDERATLIAIWRVK